MTRRRVNGYCCKKFKANNRIPITWVMGWLLISVMVTLGGCAGVRHITRDGSQPADMVIVNGRIFTSGEHQSEAEAMAVTDGRITYVGSSSGIADFVGADTRIIDARNRRITPGFVDSHCHTLWIGALLYLMPDNLFACENFEDISQAVLNWESTHPSHPFIGGIGWRMDQVPGGRPRKETLDAVIKDRPVILMSYSGQGGWMNTLAVTMFQQRNPEALERLKPVRDEDGELTGEFQHFHAINFMDYFTWEEFGEETQEGMMKAMTKVLDEAASVGVTAVHDVQIYPEFVPLLLSFRDRNGFQKVRAQCAYYVDPHQLSDEEQFKQNLTWWKTLGETESGPTLIFGRSLKLYIDGTPDNHTSLFFEPYLNDPDNYGDPVWSQEEFNRLLEIIDGMELQACTHSCGDAGANRVINAYEHAQLVNGRRDSRHRLEHCEFPKADDIQRMARLGITAAMQPCHFFGDKMAETGLGNERMQRFMPWRSLEKAGVTIGFGSDWCNSPLNPFYGLILCSKRFNYKGKTDWGIEEKISVENAIRHWTIGSARVMFMDEDIGSLEVGKFADFVMFNTDPLKVDSLWFLLTHDMELGKLENFVDLTVLGGNIVYQKPDVRL